MVKWTEGVQSGVKTPNHNPGAPPKRGTSNTLTYLIILGVTLSIIAYTLSAFLQFQTQIKSPVQQSLNATSRSSGEFQAALSGEWGFFPARAESNQTASPDSAAVSINLFPPYFQNAPALFQVELTNPAGSIMRIEKLRLEVRRGNATILPEPGEFENIELAYKKAKDSYFTPQSSGNYTIRAGIIQNSTEIKYAEKTIFVQPPPNSKQAAEFSGTADFSLNTTTHELFYYELKNRHFPATGSGKTWRIRIPQNFSATKLKFLNFTRNANTGIGSQLVQLAGTYFNTTTEGGYDSLLTSESTTIQANATADYLAVLAASSCSASILLRYENSTETANLSGICPLGQQCANSRQTGAVLKRESCGEPSQKYLHASNIPLRKERLLSATMQPSCEIYVAGLTLGTEKTHTYGKPSAAYLIAQNASLVYVNNRQHPFTQTENFNTPFQKIDLTTNIRSGETDFNISTDTPLSFTPYLIYTEILNEATNTPNISGSTQNLKLILIPDLESHADEFSNQFSYGSSAGSCYSETGLWSFGRLLGETPEVSIGASSLQLSTTFDWPSNSPPAVSSSLDLPSHSISQSATQIGVLSGTPVVSLEGYNTPNDGTPLIYSPISHADTNVQLDYSSTANLKFWSGSVEAVDYQHSISGITDQTRTITIPDNLLGLYLVVKSDMPRIKYPLAVAGIYTKAEIFGETHSARGYWLLQNGWSPQGYSKMIITEEALFIDLTQKALPGQQASLRVSTETDTANSLESNSGTIHLVAVKKRPLRTQISAGNHSFQASALERTELPLESADNLSVSIEGTGRLRGELEVSSIKDSKTKMQAPLFGKALLLLEPKGRITNLQIIVNNQPAKAYPELSNIEKTDLSSAIVPSMENTIEFKGSGGALNWKLIFE